MCGIVGIVQLNGPPVDLGVLQRMNDLQAHRGPDGEGFLLGWDDAGGLEHAVIAHTGQWQGRAPVRVTLGHRRLAILDLSDRGLQPMTVDNARCWIVFNGEIYNHRELRTELAARGYTFGTRTDTEVLLQAYREWGEDCLARLEGMYAFAIWDATRRRLFCARDRLGIKPFYYASPGGTFAFASEMKALLACPGLDPTLDPAAVIGFLVHANCDYGARTLLGSVHALPPAHCLIVDLADGRVNVRRYWQLAPQTTNHVRDAERLGELRTRLEDTVRRHLISDVRAGSCLSGGIDSSSIVSLIGQIWRDDPAAATALGDRFFTFTSCWDDPALDERAYAGAVARAVGTDPHHVFPSASDFWDEFPRMAWHQDMPFGCLSYYAQWCVMRTARRAGVKVLLDGQGGDEVFGGYAKFRYAYLASLARSGHLLAFGREMAAMLGQGDRYVLDLRRGYRYLPAPVRRLLGVDSLLASVLRADWGGALAGESTPATRWWRHASGTGAAPLGPSVMQRIQIDDIVFDTLPQLLRMEDRSSMAFSLEARVPLLDHPLVEYGLALPDRLKVHRGWSKFALREALRGVIPEVVRQRTSKLGFAAPDRRWLAQDLRPQVTELIEDTLRCESYVDVAALRRWYRSPRTANANEESYLGLFRVLALEMWMRAFHLT